MDPGVEQVYYSQYVLRVIYVEGVKRWLNHWMLHCSGYGSVTL